MDIEKIIYYIEFFEEKMDKQNFDIIENIKNMLKCIKTEDFTNFEEIHKSNAILKTEQKELTSVYKKILEQYGKIEEKNDKVPNNLKI